MKRVCIKRGLFLLTLIFVFLVSCKKEESGTEISVMRGVDYSGFEAQYINHDEDVCSTVININSDGLFAYYYNDGCIYEDFDLYETYSYDSEKNLIIAESEYIDDFEFEILEWTTEKLVLMEDGEKKSFDVSGFFYYNEGVPEGAFVDSETYSNRVTTIEFIDENTVKYTKVYDGGEPDEQTCDAYVLYEPNKDLDIVVIDEEGWGKSYYIMDKDNHKLSGIIKVL